MAVDYDAPRVREDDVDTEPLEAVAAARATQKTQPAPVEELDAVESGGFELPGADLLDELLVVEVQPQQADEFTCAGCFLVRHRSQLVDPVAGLCVDCV